MGGQWSILQSLKNKLYGHKEVKILICGLDAAGKTTMLYNLKLGEVVTTIPTIGFNVETVEYKKISVISWDIGGRDKVRPLWRHYYKNTDALMFVVDSNDRDRIEEVRDELWRFLGEDELKDCVVLIMANKQDLPNAMTVEELTEKLKLNKIKDKTWYIQASCATSGDGLFSGLDWLHDQLTGAALKQSVTKPIQETKEALGKQGPLSSWFSSISNYWKSISA